METIKRIGIKLQFVFNNTHLVGERKTIDEKEKHNNNDNKNKYFNRVKAFLSRQHSIDLWWIIKWKRAREKLNKKEYEWIHYAIAMTEQFNALMNTEINVNQLVTWCEPSKWKERNERMNKKEKKSVFYVRRMYVCKVLVSKKKLVCCIATHYKNSTTLIALSSCSTAKCWQFVFNFAYLSFLYSYCFVYTVTATFIWTGHRTFWNEKNLHCARLFKRENINKQVNAIIWISVEKINKQKPKSEKEKKK